LLPAVGFFSSVEGAGVVDFGGEEFWGEGDVGLRGVAEAGFEAAGPEGSEVGDVGGWVVLDDGYLHAAGGAYAAVEEADSFDDGLDEFELALESSVDHLAAGVPVGEVAVEAEFGEAGDELDGALEVLEEGGSVGLGVEGDFVFLRGLEDGFYEGCAFVVGFHAPAEVEG